MVEVKEGWGFPRTSRKDHYFVGVRSLCRKWGFYLGPLEQGKDDSPDNCAKCKRALAKRKQTLRERQKKLQKYLDNGLRKG